MIKRQFRCIIVKRYSNQTLKRFLRYCGCAIIFLLILRLYHLSEIRDILQRSKYHQLASNDAYYRNFKCLFRGNLTNFSRNRQPWMVVDDRKFVAANAYFDSVYDSNYLRIFGLRNMLDVRPYLCIFYSSKDSKTWEIQTKVGFSDLVNEMQECVWLRFCAYNPYDAFYVSCPVKDRLGIKDGMKYNYVSLLPTEQLINGCVDVMKLPKLVLNEIRYLEGPKHNFTVCVSPRFNWTNVLMLKMFLEHYLSQGFTKFVIYKRSWTKNVDDIIKKYSSVVQVVDWPPFPNVSYANLNIQVNVHYNAQILAVNDCIWRLKGQTMYLAVVDFDEFLTPSNNSETIADIILKQNKADIGGFYFQNRFFLFSFQDINAETKITFEENYLPAPTRSKMIIKPEVVQKFATHNVWKYRKGFTDKIISSDSALMLHWKMPGDKQLSGRFLKEKYKFSRIFPRISNKRIIE